MSPQQWSHHCGHCHPWRGHCRHCCCGHPRHGITAMGVATVGNASLGSAAVYVTIAGLFPCAMPPWASPPWHCNSGTASASFAAVGITALASPLWLTGIAAMTSSLQAAGARALGTAGGSGPSRVLHRRGRSLPCSGCVLPGTTLPRCPQQPQRRSTRAMGPSLCGHRHLLSLGCARGHSTCSGRSCVPFQGLSISVGF